MHISSLVSETRSSESITFCIYVPPVWWCLSVSMMPTEKDKKKEQKKEEG